MTGTPLSSEGLPGLAAEQAALRRVATLVARGTREEEVFAAVVDEVGRLLPIELASMCRYESDGSLTWVASWGRSVEMFPVGTRRMLGGNNLGTIVFDTGRSARIDNYADWSSGPIGVDTRAAGINSSLATPITVEGRLWGVIAAGSLATRPLPADTEARLANFTDLVATAIANAESRAGLARLAAEQAALRRVATLAARGTGPEKLFGAVTEEVGQLLAVEYAELSRYEPGGAVTVVAGSANRGTHVSAGGRWMVARRTISAGVLRTGRSVRIDGHGEVTASLSDTVQQERGSGVGTPVIVDGRLWGVMAIYSILEQSIPPDAEERLASFTELLATAIANAESRADLAASRARVVAAADEARRRIEHDLHDGIQQRLVSLSFELRGALASVPPELGELERQLSHVADELTSVFDELREIAHGIHPATLTKGGLVAALRALRRRSAVPMELDVDIEGRLPQSIEVGAYYVVSEALTNAAKHARASVVHVRLEADSTTFWLAVHDDGIGGADPGQGSGLVGLRDRIETLGGTLLVTSPPGKGTTLRIKISLEGQSMKQAPTP
jgi:signal transduction histidine kinase